MECNKDEAIRAKEIAQKRFLANDFSAARKFAMKAQFLSPELDGIAQMVSTFSVHLSARNIICGEIDYYGVLGINPEADDETVRKRYRMLAVMLHPDKNKCVGADEAFKLLSQAWAVFSDKTKRAEYDLKRNPGLREGGGASSSSKPASNGSQKVNKATTKVKSTTKRGVKRASDASASASVSAAAASTVVHKPTSDGTFWTVCRTCRTQYEYHRVYLNQNLLCPNCRKPFIAVETDPPGSGSIRKTFHEHQFDSIRQTTDARKKSRVESNGVYGEYESFEWSGAYTGTKAPTHAPQTGPRKEEPVVRREYTKRAAAGGAPATNHPKRRKCVENSAAGSNIGSCLPPKPYTSKEFTEDEIKSLLKKKVKPLINKKLQELLAKSGTESNGSRMETDDLAQANVGSPEIVGTSLMVWVPKPDFCDFDKDRTEKSFVDNEVWALYDPLDGMPRSFVLIEKVLSVEPFRVRISRLTSEVSSGVRSTDWLGSGVSRTCGDFRVAETQICKSPYIFSHKVETIKGSQGEFLVYPRRGEVWAMYRNWSPEWNYLTGAEAIEYDVVEIFEEYTEEYGVSVVPLIKVAGFKAVFHHHVDHKMSRRISRDEISRFSHQIPSYLLTGQEAPGAPKGCRQLDPAATPSQLLEVIDDL
ncbi:unnamed protein product [Thlaspi arvense]|uniref:J domain-containing protein n=1 Tax=Thlaspi arvense TaxID=13288 RepID=A0AAU9S9P4_THLAR|nr:unnamed protein product [Thlaspi arvense]